MMKLLCLNCILDTLLPSCPARIQSRLLGRGVWNCDILQRFSLFPVEAFQFSSFWPNLATPTIQEYVTAVLPANDELKVGLNPLALPHLGPRQLQ